MTLTTESSDTRWRRTRVPTSSAKIEDEDVPPVGAEATIVRRVSRWRVARLHGSYRVWLGCNCQCSVADERRPASRAPASSPPRSCAAFSPSLFLPRNSRFQSPSRRFSSSAAARPPAPRSRSPILTHYPLFFFDRGDGGGCQEGRRAGMWIGGEIPRNADLVLAIDFVRVRGQTNTCYRGGWLKRKGGSVSDGVRWRERTRGDVRGVTKPSPLRLKEGKREEDEEEKEKGRERTSAARYRRGNADANR